MVFVIIVIVIIALIIFIKIKQNDDSVTREAVEFDTGKTVSQIADVLRTFDCEVHKLNDDPLNNGPTSAISVLLVGQPKLTEMLHHVGGAVSVWGVQVIVDDLGNRRHVKLVALGQNQLGNTRYNKGYGMGFSREYRDKIAQMLA